MPGNIISNSLVRDDRNFTNSKRFTTVILNGNDYVSLETNGLHSDIGIGVWVYRKSNDQQSNDQQSNDQQSNDQQLAQISLYHSASDHSSNSISESTLKEFSSMTFEERKDYLESKDNCAMENKENYFACAIAQMLSEASNDNHVTINLQTGSNYNIDKNINLEDKKTIAKWVEAYKKVTGLNFSYNIEVVDNPNHSSYFKISSNGFYYIKDHQNDNTVPFYNHSQNSIIQDKSMSLTQ